jgi:hypothetical protein
MMDHRVFQHLPVSGPVDPLRGIPLGRSRPGASGGRPSVGGEWHPGLEHRDGQDLTPGTFYQNASWILSLVNKQRKSAMFDRSTLIFVDAYFIFNTYVKYC